jgi:hypothetical protein
MFCVQRIRQNERNLDNAYTLALLVILGTSVSFCEYLISSSVFWRCVTSIRRIFLVLILTEVGFDDFKSPSNNV